MQLLPFDDTTCREEAVECKNGGLDFFCRDRDSGGGVLSWFVQGFNGVLPQPEDKPKSADPAEVTTASKVTKKVCIMWWAVCEREG